MNIKNVNYKKRTVKIICFLNIDFIPGPNLDTGMTVEFSVAFYSPTFHIYYFSLYWPDLKH